MEIWSEHVLYTLLAETIPTCLCWFNLQKAKTCPKKYIAARAICSDTRILTIYAGFSPLLKVYFNDMLKKTGAIFIKYSLRNSPSLWFVQKKNRIEKFPFIVINNWIVLAVWWYSPIFRKNCGREIEEADGKKQLQSVMLFKQT